MYAIINFIPIQARANAYKLFIFENRIIYSFAFFAVLVTEALAAPLSSALAPNFAGNLMIL